MAAMGYGIQRLIDQHERTTRAAHPVFIRLRNFPDLQDKTFAQMGFAISPTGTAVGTQDIVIDPPPAVMMVSIHNIGQSMGKLRFGARKFLISASFVDSLTAKYGYTDQTLWFRSSTVVGLVLDLQLFSIEDVWHEELSGRTVSWGVLCNSTESG